MKVRLLSLGVLMALWLISPGDSFAQLEYPYNCEICHYRDDQHCYDACDRSYTAGTQGHRDCQTCCSLSCLPPEPPPDDPLLIDFGAHGLLLTSVDDGVRFDIDGNGTLDSIAWTSGGAEDAFLALDLNLNGSIDSGKELFGDATAQSRGEQPNGFRALAEYDRVAQGGDEDGIVGPSDAIWPRLLLWVDRSHDGVSQSGELTHVAASSLTGFKLDYRESRRRDKYGNQYSYRSVATADDGSRAVAVFDVCFATSAGNR